MGKTEGVSYIRHSHLGGECEPDHAEQYHGKSGDAVKPTYSVSNGGSLCQCGHLRCQHENGTGNCGQCCGYDLTENPWKRFENCTEFKDRAEDD